MAMTVPKRGERAPPLTMKSAPLKQPRSQPTSQITTMVPSVTTHASNGRQARSTALPHNDNPRCRSPAEHVPTFELTSQSTLGVPDSAPFPLSINSIDARGRINRDQKYLTNRKNAGQPHHSSNWDRGGVTSKGLHHSERPGDFPNRDDENFPSDNGPGGNPNSFDSSLYLPS